MFTYDMLIVNILYQLSIHEYNLKTLRLVRFDFKLYNQGRPELGGGGGGQGLLIPGILALNKSTGPFYKNNI